jgi:pimeloyl-ACP methyl ester carboxylesterase
MNEINFLFIHGGPGFNSNPEKQILSEKIKNLGFTTAYFWHELSFNRNKSELASLSQNSLFFANLESLMHSIRYLKKDYEPLIICAHSYGMQYLKLLLSIGFDKLIDGMLLIAPIFELQTADKNLFKLALQDKSLESKEAKEKLNSLIKQKILTNDEVIEGYTLALLAKNLLNNYFLDLNCAQNYYQYFFKEYAFDFEAFKKVRLSQPKIEYPSNPITAPTFVLYGTHDPIFKENEQLMHAKHIFKNLKIVDTLKASHYPHIEDENLFLKTLKNLMELIL